MGCSQAPPTSPGSTGGSDTCQRHQLAETLVHVSSSCSLLSIEADGVCRDEGGKW